MVFSKFGVWENRSGNKILLNGTTTVGLTTKVQSALYSKTKEFSVVDRDNASDDTYANTLVVDFSGNETVAQKLADLVGGRVADLPEGETKPETADFLVILGTDQD
ncbi:MAG: LytR C-terminal domain-containing protein [Candidatus Levybacteria bacterium]|nr:LytR C-terminal domain-containing protein [Candidatus Levybacteria bacterium]